MLLFIATQLILIPILGLILLGMRNQYLRTERLYKAFIKQLMVKNSVSGGRR